jgi:hypothetical protein
MTPDEVLLRLLEVEDQLCYGYARVSVIHRVKAQLLREVLYDSE